MIDIIIVEDKESLRQMLRVTLEHAGYSVAEAHDAAEACRLCSTQPARLVLTDLRMPQGSGLDVLRHAHSINPETAVIVMTAYGSIDEAVQAMKDGAYDFLQKPVDTRHLLLIIGRAMESLKLRTENILLREEYARRYGFPRILGDSEPMQAVSREVQQVARTNATVLLLGESGTGKELFARAIHYLSERRNGPFLAINCAAIPESLIENELFGHEKGAYTGADARALGKFELARGGTIFLDEIGELALSVQAKILRVLETQTLMRLGGGATVPADVRIVAATNRDLVQAVAEKSFREDLYFRLAVFPVRIPPLRERNGDISLLADHFLARFGLELRRTRLTFADEARAALIAYHWPGNVRELENCIERACILCDGQIVKITDLNLSRATAALPQQDPLPGFDLSGSLDDVSDRALAIVQRRKIDAALRECGFNKTRTAELLGISYKTLLMKIKELKIE